MKRSSIFFILEEAGVGVELGVGVEEGDGSDDDVDADTDVGDGGTGDEGTA